MLQVKKNLINVSYHIAQYTSIISDLRCEIQRLKQKIADQASRQLTTDRADIRHVQGEASFPPRLPVLKLQTTDLFVMDVALDMSSAAEVQAHSSQQSRAEMDQLREQLLDAFRQQMEIRKSLVELENSSMEIQIESSRHLLTIAE